MTRIYSLLRKFAKGRKKAKTALAIVVIFCSRKALETQKSFDL